jgi:hypothetical protein
LGLACVTSGCAKKDPIKVLLAEIEEAAEHRDARKVVDHLAPEFLGQGRTDRAEALSELRRYFVAYESVSLTLYDIQIERAEGAAEGRVRLQVDFDGRPLKIGALSGFLPPSAAYRFDLRVRDGGEGWLVSEATWEDVTDQVGER